MDDLNEMARFHSAGATVRQNTPFDKMQSYCNNFDLTEDFIKKWVVPFYMEIGKPDLEWTTKIKIIKNEITKEVCLALLGDFNWRTRLVGSYFSAVKKYSAHIDIIGIHLLKSEVCCVGHIYALTLAYFNTDKCVGLLNKYLDYYLTKPDLFFDQKYVMEAVLYLDKVNSTAESQRHIDNWHRFQTILGREKEELNTKYFDNQIQILKEISQYSS